MLANTSFAAACRDFFGLKSGQVLSDFITELKQLTDADREELKAELIRVGYTFK